MGDCDFSALNYWTFKDLFIYFIYVGVLSLSSDTPKRACLIFIYVLCIVYFIQQYIVKKINENIFNKNLINMYKILQNT